MVKLIEGTIAQIRVPEGKRDVIIFDDALPGFGVRKFASGKASYFVKYSLGIQQRKITLGKVVPGMLAEMRKEAARVLAQVRLGQDVQGKNKEALARRSVTIGSLIDRYLGEREAELKPRTMEGIILHLRSHWAPLHGQPVEKIVRREIVSEMDRIAEEHGKTAADRAKSSLSGFFAWALDRNHCETNPVLGIRRRGANPSRSRVLSMQEIADVWAACPANDYGRIVKLLTLTGQRRNEIGNLRWQEINFDRAEITLPPERTKNSLLHVVALSSPAKAILQEVDPIAGREYVFGLGAIGFQGWSKSKQTLDEKINADRGARRVSPISAWQLHNLRRSFVTHMAENRLALPHIVEACVNHQSGHRAGVAGVYNRALYANEKRAAFEAWANHISGMIDKNDKN
ncbi:MAG: site-specific integrase [Rhodomicrobium sp.]